MIVYHFTLFLLYKSGSLDVRKLGIGCFKIGIPLRLNQTLVGASTLWRSFTVSCIELIDNIHSFNDLSKGRESLLVQKAISFWVGIDKYLWRPRVWASCGKDNSSTGIRNLDWVICYTVWPPFHLDIWISVDSKLSDETRKYSKNSTFVKEFFIS